MIAGSEVTKCWTNAPFILVQGWQTIGKQDLACQVLAKRTVVDPLILMNDLDGKGASDTWNLKQGKLLRLLNKYQIHNEICY